MQFQKDWQNRYIKNKLAFGAKDIKIIKKTSDP